MATQSNRTKALQTQFAEREIPSRPIITYINGDVSWLVSFPRPATEQATARKAFYHVVIDPWFGQPSVVVTPMVLEMRLGREPGLPNRAAIDTAIAEIEQAVGKALVATDADPAVDAIFVMGRAEHFHRESLLQFAASTPLFAVAAVAGTAASWAHFDTVVTMSSWAPTEKPWKDGHPGAPLPAWLTVFPPRVTRLNHFGLCLVTSANPSVDELILMAPHGMSADEAFLHALGGTLAMLALVAPLKDAYSLGIRTVLGVEDGLALARNAASRYYVRSGDFVSLKYKGIIGWTLKDVPHDMQWGVDQLSERLTGKQAPCRDPALLEIGNGKSYVLV